MLTYYNYDEFISEIMKLFPDDYINNITKKLKEKEILQNVEYYQVKLKEKRNLYYYNELEIINDKIDNLIQKLFKIEYKEKRTFLFGDNKIIIGLDYLSQPSIVIGNYNNNYFEGNILLYFYEKPTVDIYFKKFFLEGYNKALKNINFGNESESNIKDNNSKIIGKAYKIYELENYKSTPTDKDIKNSIRTNNTTNESILSSVIFVVKSY